MRLFELKPGTKKEIKTDIIQKTAQLTKLENKLAELTARHEQLKISFPEELRQNEQFMAKIMAAEEELQRIAGEVKAKIEQTEQSIAMAQSKLGPSKFIQKLETECSEFLAVMRKTKLPLYRGVYTSKDTFYGVPRTNRSTKDSSPTFQIAFDGILKSKGFTALRSNSIFCTSNLEQASGYGDVFLIFPVNGFTFTWSQTRDDVAIDYDDLHQFLPKKASSNSVKKAFIKKINEYGATKYKKNWDVFEVGNLDWIDIDDIENQAIDHLYYHAPNSKSHDVDENFVRENGITSFISPTLVFKDFKPDNKNLVAALKSGHEIYINGHYYAVRAESLSEPLFKKLNFKTTQKDDFDSDEEL